MEDTEIALDLPSGHRASSGVGGSAYREKLNLFVRFLAQSGRGVFRLRSGDSDVLEAASQSLQFSMVLAFRACFLVSRHWPANPTARLHVPYKVSMQTSKLAFVANIDCHQHMSSIPSTFSFLFPPNDETTESKLRAISMSMSRQASWPSFSARSAILGRSAAAQEPARVVPIDAVKV